MKKALKALLFFMCCILTFVGSYAQAGYNNYCNGRFGYCLKYPSMLNAQPEAQNGDGRIFRDKNGKERLRVYGTGNWTFNADGNAISLPELYRIELRGGRFPAKPTRIVTYSALKRDWFVLSGTIGAEIFYLKVIVREDAFCYALLKYSKTDSASYRPVAAKLAASFR